MCKRHVWLTINRNIIKIVIRQSATHRSCSFCGNGVIKTDFVFLEIENCDTKMINDSKQGAAVAQEVCQSVCTVWMVSVPDEHCKLCHQFINGWMLTWVVCLECSSFYNTVYIYIHIRIYFFPYHAALLKCFLPASGSSAPYTPTQPCRHMHFFSRARTSTSTFCSMASRSIPVSFLVCCLWRSPTFLHIHVLNFWPRPTGVTLASRAVGRGGEGARGFNKFLRALGLILRACGVISKCCWGAV